MTAWAMSLAGADLGRMAGIGLLDALPPAYFLGFALLLGGFVAAVSRPVVSPGLLSCVRTGAIVVLHGTTPLLYDQPRYAWTFTHLGVINLIAETGGVDRHVDIYNNWPGFFALNAWLSRVTGVAPATYAEWAQVFFNLANVAAVRFALRGVTGDERLLWTAAWLFVLGNWIGQDYLAPQAFAFVLAVVMWGWPPDPAPGAGATDSPGPVARRRPRRAPPTAPARASASRIASAQPALPARGAPRRRRLLSGRGRKPPADATGPDRRHHCTGSARTPRSSLGSGCHGIWSRSRGLRSPGRT